MLNYKLLIAVIVRLFCLILEIIVQNEKKTRLKRISLTSTLLLPNPVSTKISVIFRVLSLIAFGIRLPHLDCK